MPGEKTWKETEELLHYLGAIFDSKGIQGYAPNAYLHGVVGFDFKNVTNDFYFEETDGVIDAILIKSHGYDKPEEFQALWKNYSLKKILGEYGIPDRVLLNVTYAYNLGRSYHLWLFYDELGFMIRYPGGVSDAPVLHICPTLEGMNAIDLSLQAPNSPLPLERFDAILEDIRLQTETGKTRGLHSIQDASGLNEEEFHDLFIQEEELICFDTPSSIWDVKQ